MAGWNREQMSEPRVRQGQPGHRLRAFLPVGPHFLVLQREVAQLRGVLFIYFSSFFYKWGRLRGHLETQAKVMLRWWHVFLLRLSGFQTPFFFVLASVLLLI